MPTVVKKNTTTAMTGFHIWRGGIHSCATTAATLYCWGFNGFAEIMPDGKGTPTEYDYATFVTAAYGVDNSVAAGEVSTCAVDSSGRVSCWGSFDASLTGSLYAATTIAGITASKVVVGAGGNSCALLTDNRVACWGAYPGDGSGATATNATAVVVPGFAGVTQVSAGANGSHKCLLKGGTIYCWGPNIAGEVGDATLAAYYVPTRVAWP